MKYMTYGFFLYAFVNFAIAVIRGVTKHQASVEPTPDVWQSFSGHWMFFYSAGLAILMTAYRRGLTNLSPKCRNGHVVDSEASVCPTCGAKINLQAPDRVAQ
jgi:hypothetical protein